MNQTDLKTRKGIMQLIGLLLLGCLATINLEAQSARLWEKTYGTSSTEEIQAIVTKPNGDNLMGGTIQTGLGTFQFFLLRTDVDGDLIYAKDFGEPIMTEFSYDLALTNEGVIMVGEERVNLDSPADILAMSIDDAGELLWSKNYGGGARDIAHAVITTSDGGFVIAGESASFGTGDNDMFLLKLNAVGDSVWMKTFDNAGKSDKAYDLVEKTDGSGYVAVGRSGNVGADMFLIETDLTGTEINRNVVEYQGNLDAQAIVITDSGYLVAGTYTRGDTRGFISKIALNLSEKNNFYYGNGIEQGFNDLISTGNGNFVAGGFIEESSDPGFAKAFLVEVDTSLGFSLAERIVGGYQETKIIAGLAKAANTGEVVCAGQVIDILIVPDAWFLRTEASLYLPEKFIEGKVVFDTGNCQVDLGERQLSNWIVSCVGNNETLYATTDEEGNYFFRVDTGSYTVNLSIDNKTWRPCFNGNLIEIDEAMDTVELNFPVQAEYDCAHLEIDASAPNITICEATDFQIFYCNKGTVDAQNARVEILLDEFLTINSATLPITFNDSLYSVDIGEIKAGDCGKFSINATLDCNEPVTKQAHKFTARIFPDSICVPLDPSWDGSSIQVSADCQNDSVRFTIKNVGDDMTQGRQTLVIEDELFIRAEPVQLDSGQSTIIAVPSDGTTYRIVAEQSEFHPGKSNPTVALEGCVQTPTPFSTGHVTRFEEDEKNPFISIEVMENENPGTDFTLLRGYPKGVEDSLITSRTDLEYHFRFENRGNDTIRRIVVRDTISQNLDISTIRYGTSSHPYSFRVYEKGVVKFIFDDIKLPPITVNQPGSRGFVKFKISQKPNNPAGTLIENSVAMNQDFETVKIPNRTRHTIGGDVLTDFIEVRPTSTNETFFPGVDVKIYPIPAMSYVTFEISGVRFKEYQVEIIDLSGKIISKETQSQNRFTIKREHLNIGVQFYRITADGNLLNTGKIIVH